MTPVTPRHFCVAGVALGDIHLDFTWQAQLHIHGRFAWEAWDRWHWVARLDWFRRRRDARDAAPLLRGFKFGHLHAKLRSFRHVFFFPRASACLILACLSLVICMQSCSIPHTHKRPGAGLARGREAGLNCVSATLCSADMTDSVSCMQTFIVSFLSFCFGRFGPTRSC